MYWFYLFIGATFLTGLIAVLALPHSFSQVSHLILAPNWPLLCQMRGAMFITECLLCALPRPHYSAQSLRLGSTGPSEEVRPRQKTSKVRHPMRWFSRPKFRISRWKYIVRRHRREGKVQKNAHFSFSGQRHFQKAIHACTLSFYLDASSAFAADTYTEMHWPRRPGKTPLRTGTRQFRAYGGMVGFKSIHLHLRQKEMMYGNDKWTSVELLAPLITED